MAYPKSLFQKLEDIVQSIDALDRKLAHEEYWQPILTMLEWAWQQGEPPVRKTTGTENDFVSDTQYHDTLAEILRFIGRFDRPCGKLPPPSESDDFRSNDRLRVLGGKYRLPIVMALRWAWQNRNDFACPGDVCRCVEQDQVISNARKDEHILAAKSNSDAATAVAQRGTLAAFLNGEEL